MDTSRENFSSLSIKDLLEAREAYHFHLISFDTVVATAIGRYRMQVKDPCAKDPFRSSDYGRTLPRTLSNSVVRPWSWPCILVFVKDWYNSEELRRNPRQAVPTFLYLSNGKVVPTCVILAPPSDSMTATAERLSFPNETIGGGYPCFTNSQGQEQKGTIGVLVTREGETFALTNRHVTGRTEKPLFAFIEGDNEKIGVSDPVHIRKKLFQEVYPEWPGKHTMVNLDAGLIYIDDLTNWTSQVFGIGEVGELVDMHANSISLNLIGTPVRAFGSTSGPSEGEIHGLFYRYCTKGGIDYVADLLIGPRTDVLLDSPHKESSTGKERPRLNVQPGDSGTIIFIDPPKESRCKDDIKPEMAERARRLRPIAMLWGGVQIKSNEDEEPDQYALATFLSTICRELDVELEVGWNRGYREYWGKSAHFKIGYKFCELLSDPVLKDLIQTNRDRIGFSDSTIGLGEGFSVGRGKFVPLADVPDYVWVGMAKSSPVGGPRANELAQHFADIDEKAPDGGPSLLDLCKLDPEQNLRAKVWQEFYAKYEPLSYGPEPGMLPFRVRQIYEAMVDYLHRGNVMEFVSAAGILSHYVADSCIPLHFSTLHHGHAPKARRDTEEYKAYKKTRKYKIHALFEQRMFEVKAEEMLRKIDAKLEGIAIASDINNGQQAINRTFKLMAQVYDLLSPEKIISSDDLELTQRERAETLFNAVGDQAAECVALGCIVLAELVEGAWNAGKGNNLPIRSEAYSERDIQKLYRSSNFLPALTFDELIAMGY